MCRVAECTDKSVDPATVFLLTVPGSFFCSNSVDSRGVMNIASEMEAH